MFPPVASCSRWSSAPLFSVLEDQYVAIREGGGATKGTLSTVRTRVQVFKDLMGDRPLDCYVPMDLQQYVTEILRQISDPPALTPLGITIKAQAYQASAALGKEGRFQASIHLGPSIADDVCRILNELQYLPVQYSGTPVLFAGCMCFGVE